MSTMNTKFKVAGVSRKNGQVKVRFACDMLRVKALDKDGQTEINLVELPEEMLKPAIVTFLLTTELMQNPEYRNAIEEANEKYNGTKDSVASPKAPKVTKTAKVAKTTKTAVTATTKAKAKPSLDAIKARAAKKVTTPAATE